MNSKSKDLIKYLTFIGIITESTNEIFEKCYKQLFNNNNKKKQVQKIDTYNLFFKVLELYFNTIKREDKSSISNCIILKYLQNKQKLISNYLFSLINNYENKKKLIYLFLWYEKVKKIKEESFYLKELKKEELIQSYENLSSFQKMQLDLLSRQKKYIDKYKKNKINKLNENEKLNHILCPFTPQMQTKNSKNEKLFLKYSERNPFKRLYNDREKRAEKRQKIEDEINYSIKKNSLFRTSNKITRRLNKKKINEELSLFQHFNILSCNHKRNISTNLFISNPYKKENKTSFSNEISDLKRGYSSKRKNNKLRSKTPNYRSEYI